MITKLPFTVPFYSYFISPFISYFSSFFSVFLTPLCPNRRARNKERKRGILNISNNVAKNSQPWHYLSHFLSSLIYLSSFPHLLTPLYLLIAPRSFLTHSTCFLDSLLIRVFYFLFINEIYNYVLEERFCRGNLSTKHERKSILFWLCSL